MSTKLVVSIDDMVLALTFLVKSGKRLGTEPFVISGMPLFEDVKDGRTGEVVARGTCEVDEAATFRGSFD